MKRTVGPVTGAASAGAALGTLIVWIGELNGLTIPQGVEGALVVLLTILGGYLVKPTGKHVNE